MKIKFIYFSFAVSLASLFGCQQQNGESSTPATQQNQVSNSPRQMAYIDPETGKLTSKPANSAEQDVFQPSLTTEINQEPLEEVTWDDGTVTMKLDGRFRSHLVVKKGCNGKMEMKHQKNSQIVSSKCVESQEGKNEKY